MLTRQFAEFHKKHMCLCVSLCGCTKVEFVVDSLIFLIDVSDVRDVPHFAVFQLARWEIAKRATLSEGGNTIEVARE